MKMLFLALISCLILAGSVSADIVDEGEIKVRFKVLNRDSFPDLQIFYMYQDYHYHMGYQPDEPERRDILDAEQIYSSSSKWATTVLEACDSTGKCVKGTYVLGGTDIVRDYNIAYQVEVVEIIGVTDSLFEYQVVDDYYVMRNGSIWDGDDEGSEDEDAYPGLFGDRPWMFYLLVPAVALFSLLLMLALRRRQRPAPAFVT